MGPTLLSEVGDQCDRHSGVVSRTQQLLEAFQQSEISLGSLLWPQIAEEFRGVAQFFDLDPQSVKPDLVEFAEACTQPLHLAPSPAQDVGGENLDRLAEPGCSGATCQPHRQVAIDRGSEFRAQRDALRRAERRSRAPATAV